MSDADLREFIRAQFDRQNALASEREQRWIERFDKLDTGLDRLDTSLDKLRGEVESLAATIARRWPAA